MVGLMTPVVYSLIDTFAASVGAQPFGYLYCHDLKEDLMGTKFFIIFVKYVVYDWG